jgi:hypothetical protein
MDFLSPLCWTFSHLGVSGRKNRGKKDGAVRNLATPGAARLPWAAARKPGRGVAGIR